MLHRNRGMREREGMVMRDGREFRGRHVDEGVHDAGVCLFTHTNKRTTCLPYIVLPFCCFARYFHPVFLHSYFTCPTPLHELESHLRVDNKCIIVKKGIVILHLQRLVAT